MGALVTLLMGLRAGEVVSRIVRDLDDGGRLLCIPDSKTAAGKRTLQVPEALRGSLLRLAEGRKAEEPLFGYHDRNWPRKWVAMIYKAAGVPRVTAHGMRGLHGTLAVETGLSAYAVAAALGHESIATTLQSYATAGSGAGARCCSSSLRGCSVVDGSVGVFGLEVVTCCGSLRRPLGRPSRRAAHGVICPIWLAVDSVNQRLPSGPVTIPAGPLGFVGVAYSSMAPDGVILPIWSASRSVNQRAPSGPGAIQNGPLEWVGMLNSAKGPTGGVNRPIWLAACSVNQRFPSGPAAIPVGPLSSVGISNGVTSPAEVTRTTRLPVRSVNHIAPSGPAVIPKG